MRKNDEIWRSEKGRVREGDGRDGVKGMRRARMRRSLISRLERVDGV